MILRLFCRMEEIMLLEFRMKNYKSFKEQTIFSMIPAPKQKGLDYSILKEKIDRKAYKALCSAVVYGPNASGKTNIIGAMDTFRSIVLRGHIRNEKERKNPNIAANLLELIPNNTLKKANPVCFAIKFVEEGLLIEYILELDLGKFLEVDYSRKITKEIFKINDKILFERGDGELIVGELSIVKKYLIGAFEQNEAGAVAIAKSGLNDEELFLMNGFKMIFSAKLVTLVAGWFSKKFTIVYQADKVHLEHRLDSPKKKSAYVEETLNKAAEIFGINSNALGYVAEGDNQEVTLYSLFKKEEKREEGTGIPAEFFESYGTIRFVNIFPIIIQTLFLGGTLVIDEFDASIHPIALMNIVNIFHNDEINIHRAQLIFNTHNPIFLNAGLFRRDEIKFVDRDDENHYSDQYALSDFKTTGKNGVRKNEDYMKNYFVDRYGAVKDVDFTPLLEKLITTREV